MIGYVLAEGDRVAEGPDAGPLVRRYIERTVDHPNNRDFAPRILEQLITEQGTKQPRSERELAKATGLRLGEIRAVLISLAAAALARPLDPAQGIWELSHDFVARAIARYLGRQRRDLLRRSGTYAAPALLAVILGAGFGIIAWSHLTTNALLLEPDSGFVVRPFDVVSDGVVYVLGSDGKLWRERSDMSTRSEVEANVTQFQAMNDRLVYVLGTDHRLWREQGDMHSRSVVDGNVAQFRAMNDGVVYVLGSDGKLWRERSDVHNRSEVDDSVARFQALNDGDVYVLGRDMILWRESADMRDRSQVEGYVLQFQALNDSVVYVLRGDRELQRKQGDMITWVDGSVENFQAMNDSLVYVLGRDRRLWRVHGDMRDRSQVDDNVENFQAMDEGLIYVLKLDGDLWREQGDARNRSQVDVGLGRSEGAKGRIVVKSP